jgi:hypothetical protein
VEQKHKFMTEKLQQVIKRELGKLPKESQEAIGILNWAGIVEEIGKKYSLNESEINDLQVQTLLVLIGLTDSDYYPQNVENEVGTSKEEAGKIAKEVLEKIFTPIGNIMLENIKKSDKVKNGKSEQNLDFILSGGDYSAFVTNPPLLSEEGAGGGDSGVRSVPVFSIKEENLKK